MPLSHNTVGPLRSWANVPHYLTSPTPTTPRLAPLASGPPPSSLMIGLRANTREVSLLGSPSLPYISPIPRPRVARPSPLRVRKGLQATKKRVAFLRAPSPQFISTSTRPQFVLPGETSPQKTSRLLEGTTTFIPNSLDLTNASPTRQSAFFAALKAARDLIDNPPALPSPPNIAAHQPSPVIVSPTVAHSLPTSPIARRTPSPPRQSDFLAALKAVQDLINNPPPPLSSSPIVVRRSPSPVATRVPSLTPKIASPIAASPIDIALSCKPNQPIRKVFIPGPRSIVPAPSVRTSPLTILPSSTFFGAAWVASRLAPKSEFITPEEDRRDRIRVLKWAANLPTPPVIDVQPIPTALHELPLSPLSSSFFRSSLGAPSPSPLPPSRLVSSPLTKSNSWFISTSPSGSPCTPTRPSGFFDWWFDSLSPVVVDVTPSAPRFLEHPSPMASSLFRSSLGAPEDSPLPCPITPRSPSPYPASPCSHTPSPVAQQRCRKPCIAGPDFSPPRGPCSFGMLVTRPHQPPCAYMLAAPCHLPSSLISSWKSVASIVGIAAGAFTLGYLTAQFLL